MGASDLTRPERRQMILDALRSGNYAATGREYGLSRTAVHDAASRVAREAEDRFEEARDELEFRREILELLESGN